MAELLCSIDADGKGATFCIEGDTASKKFLTLTRACGDSYESRSASVAAVMECLKNDQIVTGWCNELYPVKYAVSDEPLFAMERAALSVLGATEYRIHVNGLAQEDDGTQYMWMARRPATKSKYPGMLDNVAAGGQPVGLSLLDNAIKKCKEESGFPEKVSRPGWKYEERPSKGIRSVGSISYERYSPTKEVVVRLTVN